MVGASSEVFFAFSQPSGTASVIPLSWSTRTPGSPSGLSSGEGVAEVAGAVGAGPEAVGPGAARVPLSSGPSRMAAVTAAPRTSRLDRVIARTRVRLPPRGGGGAVGGPNAWGAYCGCAGSYGAGCAAADGRVCAVHAVPSHQRSVPGVPASGYQPGGVAKLMAPL